jgi:hypothetical protein
MLTTPVYDFTGNSYVLLRFKHICKISPQDQARIEYRIGGQNWTPVPASAYLGKASNYNSTGFNADSYTKWMGNDSTTIPNQSWWEEESFDLGFEVGNENVVQLRFIIKHGSVQGTQVSYGWLLDDVEINAFPYEIKFPVVEFFPPFLLDTVYTTGPHEINAKVKTATAARIKTPWLKYTATYNGGIVKNDSVLMTMVSGDSLWKGSIPQFIVGTEVVYSITGQDTTGNYATIGKSYYIQHASGFTGEVIIGTGTVGNYNAPANLFVYSFSRQLYLGTEFSPNAQGGLITKLAWYRAGTSSWTVINQSCYFRAVDDVAITSSAYIDPVTDNAELVWQGILSISSVAGWNEIILDNPFYLPPGKNLLIYWNNNNNGITDGGWLSTTTPFNSTASGFSTVSFLAATTSNLAIGSSRPNARFYLIGENPDSNSVALESINSPLSDSIPAGVSIPVHITIRNKGIANLDSCDINWTLNGNLQSPVSYTGNLPADFTDTITIGSYIPSVNKRDTITVWVSMPNGVVDSTTRDDTLTKLVYGSSDIEMAFINAPTDTIYNNTGPFEITAEIISRSGAVLGLPSLFVEYVFEGVTTYDTLAMLNTSGNLWKTTIPQKVFGSDVSYAIKLTDIAGNHVEIEDSYYIKRLSGGFSDEVIIGTGTTTYFYTPVNLYFEYSFSRQLYLGTEFSPNAQGGTITKLAWDCADAASWTFANQSCYFRAVDDAAITSNVYIDPVATGAELVWQGSLSASGSGWVEITLTQPFILPPGKNLLIYWEQKSGNWISSAPNWKHTTTSFNSTVHGFSENSFLEATTSSFSPNTARPNARFYLVGREPDSNSVALESIDSPLSDTVLAGISIPVHISMRNKGIDNLTSCEINWTLNGNLQTPVSYTGNFPEDFTDTITIGSYLPTINKWDTITVWVSMPNGVIDSITTDDTLTKVIFGSSDIIMEFVNNSPADTVNNTGPFEITAEIVSRSGAALGQPSLFVEYIFEGVTTYDTLIMLNTFGNLWQTNILQKVFGTQVRYAIKLTDIGENHIEIEDSYYIKRPSTGFSGEVIIGTGTATDFYTPVNLFYKYSFSRQLYLGTEFSPNAEGGTITKLAWNYASAASWTTTNQTCYFRAVDNAVITSSAYIDPVADNAELVWQGSLSASGAGWVEITLTQPFILPPGKNLLIYWEHKSGTDIMPGPNWRHTTTSFNSTARGYHDNSFLAATTSDLLLNGARPNARFYIIGKEPDSNSVALESINSPLSDSVLAGISVPVHISIHNKGVDNLTSCEIN